MRRVILATGLFVLAGCDAAEREARDLVAAEMRDPSSAQFRDVRVIPQINGSRAVCGEVNGTNAYGGYAGFVPFVVGSGRVHIGSETVEAIRAHTHHCIMSGRTEEQFNAYLDDMTDQTARIEGSLKK